MENISLVEKYRPSKIENIVEQDIIVNALKKTILNKNIPVTEQKDLAGGPDDPKNMINAVEKGNTNPKKRYKTQKEEKKLFIFI